MMKEKSIRIIVRGGGDLGTGTAHRIFLAGFHVVVLELPFPRSVRTAVSFASAVHWGEITVEGVRAVLCPEPPLERRDFIPVLVDEGCRTEENWDPHIIIDARMRKKPPEEIVLPENRFILGIGPYFEVGRNCHAIIETHRGHSPGRVLWQGKAVENTRVPGAVQGYTTERILRAPAAGDFQPLVAVGDRVEAGERVAMVDDTPIHTGISGMVRGILFDGTVVTKGQKVGDIDPRCQRELCFAISDKAGAIGRGALEAVFSWINNNSILIKKNNISNRRNHESRIILQR
jgi:xanthine dehydrogenase accessory factor